MLKRNAYVSVVQITDCHLHQDPEAGLYGLNSRLGLEQVVALAAQHSPQRVLLTGDIVHDETRLGYEALPSLVAPLKAPVACIPGNHDDYELMSRVLASAGLVDQQASCGKSVLLPHWQIVLLNSQVEGEVGGALSEGELDFLRGKLNEYPKHHTIVCMHHHPVAIGSRWLDRIGLANSNELFEILDQYPQVKAVVWGHVHQNFDEQRDGRRLLACPSTCIQFTPGADDFELDALTPGYRWFRLYDGGELETGVERLTSMPGRLNTEASGY